MTRVVTYVTKPMAIAHGRKDGCDMLLAIIVAPILLWHVVDSPPLEASSLDGAADPLAVDVSHCLNLRCGPLSRYTDISSG